MVKKSTLFFGYSAVFILMLLYFLPKVSLFYFAEEKLKPLGVVFSKEKLYDKGFTLRIEDTTLFVKSIESAKIASVEITPFLLYNSVDVKGVELSKTLKSFIPLHIEEILVDHSVLSPTTLYAEVSGDFGEAEVTFDIVQKKVHLKLEPSQKMIQEYKSTLREFKKEEDGGYSYDANL